MAIIPTFESLLLEVRQSLGLERHQSKKQAKFVNLDMPLVNYQAMIEAELETIFNILEMDAEARRDVMLNLMNWISFQQGLSQHIWTSNATPQQVVWHMSVFSYAPALGRILANWNLDQAFDKGMPGGRFWFLPNVDECTGQLTLPVQHVVAWLMDLLDLPMDKLKLDLGGEKAKRKDAGTFDSMERSLYNWLNGATPRIQSIEDYFPNDAKLTFKGSFEIVESSSAAEQFVAALAFVGRKELDANALREQIPMTQPGRIESILAGEAAEDEKQEFVRLMRLRYAKPEMQIVRQRLRVARMVQDGYIRLVQFLCPDVEPTCPDPYQNKVLQLLGIVGTIYNLTIETYKNSVTQAEEYELFETLLPPWDKETIYLSILPSRFRSAYKELAAMLTRRFAKLGAEASLEDFVSLDEANLPRIVESKVVQLKELDDEANRVAYLLDRLHTASPWRTLQAESDYWIVSQIAQSEHLTPKARSLAIQRMRELATTSGQAVGAILIELHTLLNGDCWDRPKDVEKRVEALLAEAEACSGSAEWEAALLQYQAKHCLAQNEFEKATALFRQALEASSERNCGSLRGEIARDLLAISVANRRLVPGEHEKPFRHMLASGMFDGRNVSLEDTAKEVAEYFWDTLYKPYPSYAKEKPLAATQAKKISRETLVLIENSDWDGLRTWLKANAKDFRKTSIRHVRGDSLLLVWLKMLHTFEERLAKLPIPNPDTLISERSKLLAHLENRRQAICVLIQAWPEQANMPDFKGQTALMLAAQRGDIRIVQALLEAGADVDLQDYLGRTALHGAVSGASAECVSAILARNPDTTKVTIDEGSSAMHTAVKMGRPDILRLIVNHEPALLRLTNFAGHTPLSLGEKILEDLPAFLYTMKCAGRHIGGQHDYLGCVAQLRHECVA